jgi:hypothetical protein
LLLGFGRNSAADLAVRVSDPADLAVRVSDPADLAVRVSDPAGQAADEAVSEAVAVLAAAKEDSVFPDSDRVSGGVTIPSQVR